MKQLYIDIRTKLLSISDGVYTAALTRTGNGLNDITFTGSYSALKLTDYITVTINTAGATDTYNATNGVWSITNISMTAGPVYLINGISITFAATTGHTAGNTWTYTVTSNPLLKFVQVWNNQVLFEKEALHYNFAKPACFIELVAPSQIQQLGNGSQLYDELICKLHIVHEFFNATDGNGILEQDLTIFDLRQKVYQGMQMFEPTGAVAFVRVSESQQFDHDNVYEFIQEYKTNYTDHLMAQPIGFIVKQPPTAYQGHSAVDITAHPNYTK